MSTIDASVLVPRLLSIDALADRLGATECFVDASSRTEFTDGTEGDSNETRAIADILLSKETIKMLQLQGFNYCLEIGEPLLEFTHKCEHPGQEESLIRQANAAGLQSLWPAFKCRTRATRKEPKV